MRVLVFAFILGALLNTASASKLNCWVCDVSSNEECIANRTSMQCAEQSLCSHSTQTLVNTTTGKTTTSVKRGCSLAAFCSQPKAVCGLFNFTTTAPMKMIACNFSCCSSGPDCVNSTSSSNASFTKPTTVVHVPVTSAPTTKRQAAYTASPWATDMSLCKQKCCGGTPAQIWQNRTCCSVHPGGCIGVALTQEVKCEDTYCNQKHCGACQLSQKPLIIMLAGILLVVHEFLL